MNRRLADLKGKAAPLPFRLAALAERIGEEETQPSSQGLVGSWPPRPLDVVVHELAQQRPVRVLEVWRLLADADFWQQERSKRRATRHAQNLWLATRTDAWLRRELTRRTALALSNIPTRCPPEVATHGREQISMLRCIANNDGAGLLREVYRASSAPAAYLQRRGAPTQLPIRQAVSVAIAPHIIHEIRAAARSSANKVATLQQWACATIVDETLAAQDAICPVLLETLNTEDLAPYPDLRMLIVTWGDGARARGTLPAATVSALSALKGTFSYDRLRNVAETIVGFRCTQLPMLWGRGEAANSDEKEARRVLSMIEIWSNYTTRMRGIVLHIPDDLVYHFENADGSLPENVVGTDGTIAAAVIDFGKVLVLQDLYSTGHITVMTQFFTRGTQPLERLTPYRLDSSGHRLGTVKLASWGWQSRLYHAIHDAGVRPDARLKQFRGVPRNSLDPKTGLPRPVTEKRGNPSKKKKKKKRKNP